MKKMKRKISLTLCLILASTMACVAAEQKGYGKLKPERVAVIEKLEAGVVDGAVKLPWRLYVPEGADKEHPLPLVVFLHGAGRKGTDNIGPMDLAWDFITPEAQAKHPCFVLAPQTRRSWTNYNIRDHAYSADAAGIASEMKMTLELVDQMIKTRPIDPARVYVVGQSLGGFGTWEAIIRQPDLWAAAVPICGAGDPSKAESIKGIAVWAWHGENDSTVPVSGSRDMIEALKKAGADPKYTEIPRGGHGAWVKAFSDPALFEWLFSQRKP